MKNNNVHSRIVLFRLTPDEYAELQRVQRKTSYSMSRFVRTLLLEKSPHVLDKETAECYKNMLKQVQAIGSNINQITKAHNALATTKVHFTQATRQVVTDTLHIMQLWDKNKKQILQAPK
jgi:hypothetical protein